jgi:hypothetical protein
MRSSLKTGSKNLRVARAASQISGNLKVVLAQPVRLQAAAKYWSFIDSFDGHNARLIHCGSAAGNESKTAYLMPAPSLRSSTITGFAAFPAAPAYPDVNAGLEVRRGSRSRARANAGQIDAELRSSCFCPGFNRMPVSHQKITGWEGDLAPPPPKLIHLPYSFSVLCK